MDRRAFLKTSAAAGAMLATTRGAIAETESPPGNTSVPLHATGEERLPLGPLPNSRYPDEHIEVIDKKRFKGSPGTGAVERVAPGFRWAEGPAYFAAGCPVASTAAGAWCAPNTMAPLRWWPIATTASGSTRPTTWWSPPTDRSGS